MKILYISENPLTRENMATIYRSRIREIITYEIEHAEIKHLEINLEKNVCDWMAELMPDGEGLDFRSPEERYDEIIIEPIGERFVSDSFEESPEDRLEICLEKLKHLMKDDISRIIILRDFLSMPENSRMMLRAKFDGLESREHCTIINGMYA